MSKWYPIVFAIALSCVLIAGVYAFFSGVQLIVFKAPEWKNHWLVITGMGAWLLACLFAAIYTLEYVSNKAKAHLTGAL